ncbi:MAG TPA: hypothetical protein VGL09_03190 [Methylomirabilota bacterium]
MYIGVFASKALLAVAVSCALGCAGRAVVIGDDLAPRDLRSLVDSDAARDLLADLVAQRSLDPSLEARAPGVARPDILWERRASADAYRPDLPDQTRLRDLARHTSVDFAALSFARALTADAMSRAVQAAFDRFLHDGTDAADELRPRPGVFPYTVLFAPSWMHRTHPETGADFAAPRRLAARLGIRHRVIDTEENASIEDNAVVIAAAIRAARTETGGVIVISASKSGAEVALALTRLLAPEETRHVAAWVNVVGALHGSPLADAGLRPPLSWFTRTVFWVRGWNWDGVASMATDRSRRRLQGARMPESIAVVNVVAIPVSGSVGATVWWGYRLLLRHGPNDGVVLLADTVWPGGANIVAIGPDHLFAPREDDQHSVALMRAIDVAVQLHRLRRERAARVLGSARP